MAKTGRTNRIVAKSTKTNNNPKFSVELFDSICNEITQAEYSLVKICKKHNVSTVAFYSWVNTNVELLNKYTYARELQAEYLADQIIEISDDSVHDAMTSENGRTIANHEFINRSRLRVDARKWYASKLDRKRYGDKLDQDLKIDGEIAITPIRIIE